MNLNKRKFSVFLQNKLLQSIVLEGIAKPKVELFLFGLDYYLKMRIQWGSKFIDLSNSYFIKDTRQKMNWNVKLEKKLKCHFNKIIFLIFHKNHNVNKGIWEVVFLNSQKLFGVSLEKIFKVLKILWKSLISLDYSH